MMAGPGSAWLLLSFSQFPVRHPVRWLCIENINPCIIVHLQKEAPMVPAYKLFILFLNGKLKFGEELETRGNYIYKSVVAPLIHFELYVRELWAKGAQSMFSWRN